MDSTIFNQTAAAFEELDFSEENERIAELEAEIERSEAARTTAQARVDEIRDELRGSDGPSASAVARALLDNVPPRDATTTVQDRNELQRELDLLRSAMVELYHNIQRAQREVKAITASTKTRARAMAVPLIEAVKADAKSAAETLIRCFASLKAIDYSMDGLSHETGVLGEAIGVLSGETSGNRVRFIAPAAKYDVPPEIVETLRSLQGKGSAYTGKAYETAARN